MDELLTRLRAAAEPTRLRILALCAEDDLTVSEFVRLLGQSQPRVSRHLKLLVDAGLVERRPEGSWVFHRMAREGEAADVGRRLVEMLPTGDAQRCRDLDELAKVRAERARQASEYFRRSADQWDRLRKLHVDDGEVERNLLAMVPADGIGRLLDVGTGTGRMLELYGASIDKGLGIDLSSEMLAVARAHLSAAGLDNCSLRQADMFHLPCADASFDAVILHQVLHFVDRPEGAVAEAARVLRPGGRLAIVDFLPHDLETLRVEHAHRRLGFAEGEVGAWLAEMGLEPGKTRQLPGRRLTVGIWVGHRPAAGSEP